MDFLVLNSAVHMCSNPSASMDLHFTLSCHGNKLAWRIFEYKSPTVDHYVFGIYFGIRVSIATCKCAKFNF